MLELQKKNHIKGSSSLLDRRHLKSHANKKYCTKLILDHAAPNISKFDPRDHGVHRSWLTKNNFVSKK